MSKICQDINLRIWGGRTSVAVVRCDAGDCEMVGKIKFSYYVLCTILMFWGGKNSIIF